MISEENRQEYCPVSICDLLDIYTCFQPMPPMTVLNAIWVLTCNVVRGWSSDHCFYLVVLVVIVTTTCGLGGALSQKLSISGFGREWGQTITLEQWFMGPWLVWWQLFLFSGICCHSNHRNCGLGGTFGQKLIISGWNGWHTHTHTTTLEQEPKNILQTTWCKNKQKHKLLTSNLVVWQSSSELPN